MGNKIQIHNSKGKPFNIEEIDGEYYVNGYKIDTNGPTEQEEIINEGFFSMVNIFVIALTFGAGYWIGIMN